MSAAVFPATGREIAEAVSPPEYLRLLGLLMARFEFYRKNPWGEGESPILRVTPERAASWGFG